MKIIKPMDGIEGKSSNDAPPDEFQIWQPDGRLNSFPDDQLLSVGGNFVFYAPLSFSNKTISIYDLATGGVDSTVTDSAIRYIAELSASPDGTLIAYSYALDNGDSGVKVYDTSSSQVVYNRVAQGSNGYISWAPDSSAIVYYDQSLGFSGKFLYCVKAESAAWGAPTVSANLLDESGLTVSGIISLSPQTPRISDTGIVFVAYRATENQSSGGDTAVVLSRLSSPMAITHTQLLPSSVYPQGILANEVRSEVAIIHGGTGASFFDYADLTPIGTPGTLSGTAYKGVAVSLDGTEFTLQASSVQPYNRTFSLTDYSEPTAMPAVDDYAGIYYATDYFLGVSNDGSYDIVDLATNALITQANPTVTKGDIYTYQSRNYEALTDNSDRPDLGAIPVIDPETGDNLATWLDLGYINPLRMFDGKLDSRTTAPSPLTITVTPGMITNGLALFNVSAASVQVVMDDPTDGVVYDSGEIQMLDNSVVNNWWEFFFAPYLEKADLALIDLPPYPDATLTITLSSDGGDVALGEMVLGRVQNIGEAQYGTSVGIIDASTKERDVFGNFEIIERKFSKRAEFDVSVPTSSASGMQRILAQYRATPVVWVGNMGLEATIVYGFYRDFQINFSHYSLSDATITVEGL